jgi:chromosome segregation ATPase
MPDSSFRAGDTRTPLMVLAAVVVLGLFGLFLYSRSVSNRLAKFEQTMQASLSEQSNSLQQLIGRLDQTDTRHADLQGEFMVTKERLGMTQNELQRARQIAGELARQQREDAEKLSGQLGQLQQDQRSTVGSLGSLSTDVVGVKSEVKETQDQLAATRAELTRVVGDLGVQSGLIARTQSDLSELRQRGDRDYVEFDLKKSAKRQRFGTVQLELKKTDEKRQRYTINLLADDRTIEKKDKTVFEPVQFYRVGDRQPTEIVVQQIFKDRIVGYVSSPKRQPAAASASSNSAS